MLENGLSDLLKDMLRNPLDFSDKKFNSLVESYKLTDDNYNAAQAFKDLRECIRKIYDLNEEQLFDTSNANKGVLGFLNRRCSKKRKKRYYKKVENQKANKKYIRIYAEGDSWFQFPVYVKDIVDWLNDNNDYLIYTNAYGGDWITNIIYEGQYVEALTVHSPDVFLVSGGGNDLVGSNRLAVMVSKDPKNKAKYTEETLPKSDVLKDDQRKMVLDAQKYITKEFYAFIWVMKMQYTILFKQLYSSNSKHKHILSLTQGYAYPYPKKGVNFSFRYPLQPLINFFLDSGQWLFRPLMIKGILNRELQRSIILTFIYEFNQMMIDISKNPDFKNVHHIDCRKIPQKPKDWFDELHLKSHVFGKVAALYEQEISNSMSES